MSKDLSISRAFILGAGLGTRLRPLTNQLPKPLVPVWNAPLISFAFDHLIHDLSTSEFLVNTHHAAEKYTEHFPDHTYRGYPVEFRHEETLLDTAGGLDNIRDWCPKEEVFIVYNGDILTDLPLQPAVEAHRQSKNLVTLILRSDGANPNVAYDANSGRITDMRNALETDSSELFQFTGIYLVSPQFLSYVKPGKIESIVFPMLEAIQEEARVGGIVIDEGHWSDLGDVPSYLGALNLLAKESFPTFETGDDKCRLHPSAVIHETAVIDEISTIGAGAVIEANATIIQSVIWPRAKVKSGEKLDRKVALPKE